jgi:CheY-like chemotaxis protein
VQIITEGNDAKAFIANIRQTLVNRQEWAGWQALDITAVPPLDWIRQAKITTILRIQIPDGDGSIVWLDDSILVIFQKSHAFNQTALAAALNSNHGLSGSRIFLNLLDIEKQTDLLIEILNQRHRDKALPTPQEQPNYVFLKKLVPNIEELLHDWHTDKQVRSGRTRPLLMVVDDDAFTLKLVSQSLQKDYEVLEAKDGASAITLHLKEKPDIIFLDIGLPDCDGITLLNYMQQYDPDCHIVMFSADAYLKTRLKAYAGGAKGFLPKPFNLIGFQEQIRAWFTRK